MTLSTALRLLTGVVIFIVMARMWGPERFGSFMYLFTITSLVGLTIDYGFGQQLMREIGYNKDNTRRIMSGVVTAKLMLTGGVVVALTAVSFTAWGQSQPLAVFWILFGTCVASSFAEAYNSVFRGLGRYDEEAVIAAWVNLIHFGGVWLILVLDYGVVAIALVFLSSRLLFVTLTLRTYFRIAPPTSTNSARTFVADGIRRLREGLPFAAEVGFTNFQSQADTLIVHHFLGPIAVGIYQSGLRLMLGANTFAQVLSNVYLPTMASKMNDRAAFKGLANRLFLQMLVSGAFGLLVFGLGAPYITNTLYGAGFQELTPLLPWFGVLLLARYITASHGVTLSAIGLQGNRVVGISVALLALFASSYFLVTRFDLKGMLYASLIAVVCLYCVYAAALLQRGYPLGLNRLNSVVLTIVIGGVFFLIPGL